MNSCKQSHLVQRWEGMSSSTHFAAPSLRSLRSTGSSPVLDAGHQSRKVERGEADIVVAIRRSQSHPQDPIFKPAANPCSAPGHSAAFIFVHGLGDDAQGLENVADQFQNNEKLSWMNWIIPNAKEHRDAMTTAWYRPTSLSPFPPSRPELADEEDEEGMLETVTYLESLIDACVAKGIPLQRIVLGGFSQGCAMSLLTDLVSAKYSGRLAGVVGLMGYLPLAPGGRIQQLRACAGLPPVAGEVSMFLARGRQDRLIPTRIWNQTLKGLKDLGVNEGAMEVHEYEGLGHSLSGPLMLDMCKWLEKVVPQLED
nr:acyl-protein thioesterase 1 [Quercus suber]